LEKIVMRLASFVVAAMLACSVAQAADYPTKPVRVIVPYGTGSTGEAAMRVIANAIEPKLGQPIIIESRPGASGNLGAAFVAKSDPDGYTLLLGATNNFVINQHLYANIGFDPVTAFEPIGVLVELPFFIFANPQLPAKTLSEVIALAKQKPGALNYASSGVGTPMHLGAVMLGRVAGVEMTHVTYRSGAQSVAALLANEVQFYIGTVSGALQLEQENKVRILSTAGSKRAPTMPNVASAAEAGLPNFDISNWWALAAPKGTPRAVVDTLSREIRAALAVPALRDRLLQMNMVVIGNSPGEFADQIRRESDSWRDVIKAANITVN
jgi:tripartite-type tricarboxylate transporter receptor subunit TctC